MTTEVFEWRKAPPTGAASPATTYAWLKQAAATYGAGATGLVQAWEADRTNPVSAPWFTADDGEAAHKYHLVEARHLASSIEVRVVVEEEEIHFPAFVSTVLADDEVQGEKAERNYIPTLEFVRSPDSVRADHLLKEIGSMVDGLHDRERELLNLLRIVSKLVTAG